MEQLLPLIPRLPDSTSTHHGSDKEEEAKLALAETICFGISGTTRSGLEPPYHLQSYRRPLGFIGQQAQTISAAPAVFGWAETRLTADVILTVSITSAGTFWPPRARRCIPSVMVS